MSTISKATFHNKYHYITQKYSSKHKAIDYGTLGKKIPIYPVDNGKVTYVGIDSHGAKIVKVNYPKINKTFIYGHLDRIDVKKNQQVNKNTILGLTGKTGLATGIHLHLAVYDNKTKKYINPESLYIVQKGDNLTKIAKKYKTTWQNIYNKNKDIIGNNPNLIHPGQILYI